MTDDPTEDQTKDQIDLAKAYQENSEHAKKTNEKWSVVSLEANKYLGDTPTDEK